MKPLLLSFALLLLACQKAGPSPEPVSPADGTGAAPATEPAAEPAEPAEPAAEPAPAAGTAARCTTDADCVVSCARPSQCCDQLCPPCEQVFHKDELAAHEKWRSAKCAAVSCPVAKCMAPKEQTIGRCSSGQCTIERKPIASH